jgi:hypothetical protein
MSVSPRIDEKFAVARTAGAFVQGGRSSYREERAIHLPYQHGKTIGVSAVERPVASAAPADGRPVPLYTVVCSA